MSGGDSTPPEQLPTGMWSEQPPGGAQGPFARSRWKSPVRGPWLTSVFGLVLLIGIPIEFLTGLLSYAAYNPRLAATTRTRTTACSASGCSTG